MFTTLNRKARYHAHIIRQRYHWRVIADGMHPIEAAFMALVDCGDLLMRGMLFGRLSD